MSVVERIKERQKSNRESLNILRSQLTIDDIQNIKLSDFEKLDCAIQVYSEILDSEIWFCSNEEMEKEVQEENSEATIYISDELKQLVRLKPNPQKLRRINDIKALFKDSKVISSKLNT